MKKTTFLITLLVVLASFTQQESTSTQDYKDQVIELIKANPPLSNYKNYCFFQNILPNDANNLTGETLTQDQRDHLFIFAYDVFTDDLSSWRFSVSNAIDLRGVTKISTVRHTGTDNYYSINVYISDLYLAKKSTRGVFDTQRTYTSIVGSFEVTISDNADAAGKIKNDLINICASYGVKVKDGDNL